MKLRVVLVGLMLGGCYLVHERDHDAGARDVAFPDAVGLDATPTCMARCEPPRVLASSNLPAAASQGEFLESVIATPIVTPEAIFAILLASFPAATSEAELRPTLLRVSRATGEVTWLPFPAALRSHPTLHAASLHVRDDALQTVVLQSSSSADTRAASVGRGTWSETSLSLIREEDALLTAPFVLVPSLDGAATAFGGASIDIAAFTDLGFVRAFVVPRGSDARLVDLVALADEGATAPLSGAFLADGRVAIAGGGVGGLRTAARAPFLAIGRIEDAPLPARAVVGAAHDAPPLVVAEGSGYAIARHVTNDADVLRSAIRLQHYASDDSLASEVRIPTMNGRRPLWTSAFASERHAGLAWLEHEESGSDRLALRVLSPDLDRGCDSLGSAPLGDFDPAITGFVAASGDDGTVYVVTVLPNAGPTPPTVTVTEIAGCAVAR